MKDIIPLPFNVVPMNLLHYNREQQLKLPLLQEMNYVCMKSDRLTWINPGWSDKFFEIYKGQLMWYGETDLLKKVMKYGKEEN